jgi:alpha-galactosidase
VTPTIAIIGAGSAVFSLGLIRDLCLTERLHGSTVRLMDIDEARLRAISRLCERYSAETGAGIRTVTTTDRREALEGADFVLNTALVTGHGRLRDGWEIAVRHGYRFGGSLHVMHDEPFWVNFFQLRFFDEVVREVRALCPDAWYLQVANPVLAGITWLGRRYPEVKMIGLCHGFAGVYKLADALGLDHDRLTFEIPGVNHTVFLTHAYHDGQDVFPLLDAWIENEAPSYWETCPPSDYLGPVAVDLYRRFGVFPIGDTCNPGGGSWPWWYHTDAETERRWHEDPAAWWERYFSHGAERVAEIDRAALDESRPVSEVFPPHAPSDWWERFFGDGDPKIADIKRALFTVSRPFPPELSGEVMVPLVESIACDVPRVLIGNVLNSGDFVPGIPRDFAVEIPTLVSKRGIEGIQTRGLPDPVLAQIWRDRVGPVTIELAAYDEGSRERLLELVLSDPWTHSLAQAEAMMDEILAMPEHAEMRAHYQ